MSTPIDIIEVAGDINASYDAVNHEVSFVAEVAAGDTIFLSQGSRDDAPTNIPISDNQSNDWVRIPNSTLYASAGSSEGISWWRTVAKADGPLTITANKNLANCGSSLIAIRAGYVHPDILDALAVTNYGTNATPTATSDAGEFTNDVVLGAIVQALSSVTGLTVSSPFTTLKSQSGSFFQHQVVSYATTTADAATADWTESNSVGRPWQISMITAKGYTTAPTILGVSTPTPRKGSILDITCVNMGTTPGTADIGGTSQSIYSWSDELVQVICAEGNNKFGAPLNVTLTTAGSIATNTFAGITGMLPAAGRAFVDIDTPDATASKRLTATADMASGDQVDYDTAGGLVAVDNRGVPDADPSVTSFGARLWSASDGWGAIGIQTIDAAGYTPPPDTVVAGGHKPSATLELPGLYLDHTRVKWRDLQQDEKGAICALSGVTTLAFSVDGTFAGAYVLIEGSEDGQSFSTMYDTDGNPLTFDYAQSRTSTETHAFYRVRVVGGDGTTVLMIELNAS